MPWVPFESAAQAVPGARMRKRREFRLRRVGRPAELKVLCREQDRLSGNVIRFTDGSVIRSSEAKYEYEVWEQDP